MITVIHTRYSPYYFVYYHKSVDSCGNSMYFLFQHLIHYPQCIVCLLTKFVDIITLVNITYLQHSYLICVDLTE